MFPPRKYISISSLSNRTESGRNSASDSESSKLVTNKFSPVEVQRELTCQKHRFPIIYSIIQVSVFSPSFFFLQLDEKPPSVKMNRPNSVIKSVVPATYVSGTFPIICSKNVPERHWIISTEPRFIVRWGKLIIVTDGGGYDVNSETWWWLWWW